MSASAYIIHYCISYVDYFSNNQGDDDDDDDAWIGLY